MSEPDSTQDADLLEALPSLPREAGRPVFAEPWQRRVFALAIHLSRNGHFTWDEWVAALTDELTAAVARGESIGGSLYYQYWLAALEHLVAAKGLVSMSELLAREQKFAESGPTCNLQ